MVTDEERRLFIYYKSYRANIRAKVNSLRAKTAINITDKTKALNAADKYLLLMNSYINSLVSNRRKEIVLVVLLLALFLLQAVFAFIRGATYSKR